MLLTRHFADLLAGRTSLGLPRLTLLRSSFCVHVGSWLLARELDVAPPMK